MKKRIIGKTLGRVFLITNDNYLRRGVRESIQLCNNFHSANLEGLGYINASKGDVVLLDLLSWEKNEINKRGSVLAYLSVVNATVVMITCDEFQEKLTNILFNEMPKASRKEIMALIYVLCGLSTTRKLKSPPESKVFLTSREFQVINEFIIGREVKNIEVKLNINQKTLCSHKLSALRKIGCKNISHLFILTRPFMFDLELMLKKKTQLSLSISE